MEPVSNLTSPSLGNNYLSGIPNLIALAVNLTEFDGCCNYFEFDDPTLIVDVITENFSKGSLGTKELVTGVARNPIKLSFTIREVPMFING